jgi:peptide/nickel transport system substrate-binding protein
MNTNNAKLKVLFLLIAFFLFARESHAQHHDAVVEHILTDVESLNPYNSTYADEIKIENQIFETLLLINPKTLEPDIAWLAQALPKESKDHKQFDFVLRKGIKFADGKEMTGEDVIFSLKILKNPFLPSYSQSSATSEIFRSVELVGDDPYHVRFTMWKANWQTRSIFAQFLSILPRHIFDPDKMTDKYSWKELAKYHNKKLKSYTLQELRSDTNISPPLLAFAKWFAASDLQRDPKYIQGSGPYKLKEWITNDRIILERNQNYSNKDHSEFGNAYPQKLIYKIITDLLAATTALKARDIDLMGYLQPTYYQKIDTLRYPYLSKIAIMQPSYTYLGWNAERPFFKDRQVRKALAYLIDRKTIIDKILFGLAGQVQTPIFPYRKEFNSNVPLIPYDPVKAKEVLKEAGWEDHDGDGILDKKINGKYEKFSFSFLTNAGNETRKNILLVIAESMRKVGIEAGIKTVEWSVLLENLRNHNFDATFGAWQNEASETDNYMLYHSSQTKNKGSNFTNWKNKNADRLLEAIRKEMNTEKRIQLEKEFQQVFYEEQPITMLWAPYTLVAWNNRFSNVAWYPSRPGYNTAWWIPPVK